MALNMQKSRAFHHPELFTLRACAFAVIFAHHFLASHLEGFVRLTHNGLLSRAMVAVVDSGSVGLDLFFCLSSFLITSLLVREYDTYGRVDVGNFLARRSLRILPLYFGFLILAWVVLPRILPNEHLTWGYFAAFCVFGANWLCAFHGYPVSVVAPLWSVSAEQQFYLGWSWAIARLSPRRIVPLALSCLVVATITRITVLYLGLPRPAIWANTLAHLDPIALGALGAVFIHRNRWRPSPRLRRVALLAGLAIPPVLIYFISPAAFHGWWSLLFYPCTALACLGILVGTYREQPAKQSAALVYLGRISYGLFIFHLMAIRIVSAFQATWFPHPQSWLAKLALCSGEMVAAFGLALGLAALSYRYFESPFLALKTRFELPKADAGTRKPETSAANELATFPLSRRVASR